MTALWSGRFEKDMDELVKKYNASIFFDKRMYNEDIDGSIAHVKMLAAQEIINREECRDIVKGLEIIREKISNGEIEFSVSDEDIHMGVEGNLIKEIGEVGKKLHTARSRNDQVQVDLRLYLKKAIEDISAAIIGLEEVILKKAEDNVNVLMPGFTHLQHAQPVTLGFYLMAYFQMFKRDHERLTDCYDRMNYSPLGSCALSGTSLPIDRDMTAKELGFSAPTENAMDSVSDRDYVIEFLSAASISMMHLSRWAEEFIWHASSEFAYITLDDAFSTGSSIMPQKKNPDIAELIRGKTGRVYGDLVGLLTVMKGTPLAFNKDFQEDKEALFDAVDTWLDSLVIFTRMLDVTEYNEDIMRKALEKGFLNATDVADHLAISGIPFREAHEIVGKMVKLCENYDPIKSLEELTEADLKTVNERLSKELIGDISMESCVNARNSYGGTSPLEVKRQIENGKAWLESL